MVEHSHPDDTRCPPPSSDSGPDAVIRRLAALANEETSAEAFYQALVSDLVQVTVGLGTALWLADGDRLRLAVQCQLSHSDAPSQVHDERLLETLSGRQVRTFRGDADTVEILCPWEIDSGERGILELRQKADLSERALAGQERFVGALADLIVVFLRNRQVARARQREEQWLQLDRFVQAIQEPLDVDATAFEIANEGRRLTNCDRLTVLIRRRNRWKAVAVSGSDTVNRRSSVVAHLESLARLVAVEQSTIWSGTSDDSFPSELEASLDDYHEISSARLVGIVPLSKRVTSPEGEETLGNEPFAVLVFERFDQVEPKDMRQRCDAVCRHSASALHRVLAFDKMPLHRLSRLLDRSRCVAQVRQQPWTLLVLLGAIGLIVALSLVPAPLRVEATGSLQPQSRRHLFAPTDGVVQKLLVREAGQPVTEGETLIELRDPQLQFEMQRVLGDLETARKQLAGIEAERLHTDRASRGDLRDAAQRSAEEESLKKLIEGLERQRSVLLAREKELSVQSPLAGQVLTWDVEQLLQSRPVARGQILLTLADLGGPWVLELEIPDDQIADVTEAMKSGEAPLTARFILATAPEVRYLGTLEQVAPATDVHGAEGPTVSAVVFPEDQDMMRTLRPGASVVAKIDCGQKSLLYVMLRGLFRAVRTHLLF